MFARCKSQGKTSEKDQVDELYEKGMNGSKESK
jgi:hypothetical protein